jgi:hypothetical protein
VTREDVMSALDTKESARAARQIDRAIASACNSVDGQLKRVFYPTYDTRTFDWPNAQTARTWRLWLDANELISVSALSSGGTTIAASDYLLRPDVGPPYTYLELDRASNAAFNLSGAGQRSISITGVFGYGVDSDPCGALSGALDASSTAVTVTDSSEVGVGSLLLAGTEYMIVTERGMTTTTQTTTAALGASASEVTVGVATGTAYAVGETILINSERMLIVDIAGNNLTVKRATDGSVLAAHLIAQTVYAPRALTVERGACGSTAATHSDALALYRHVPPGLVSELSLAEAIVGGQQKSAGYARTIGSGDATREAIGRGLADIRARAYETYGRKVRQRAV